MSIESLIDPPNFNGLVGKRKRARILTTLLFLFGVLILLANLAVLPQTLSQSYLPPGLAISIALIIGSIFAFKRLRRLSAELKVSTSAYYQSEFDRLTKLKKKMSTGEWENFKLQVQNQRLLTAMNQRQNVKTTTMTSGFIADFSD